MGIGAARAEIEAALATVAGLRVSRLGSDLSPPAAVVGPPRLDPLGNCSGPGTATFPVNVVVALDDRALDAALVLAVAAWEAIEDESDGVVTGATPGSYTSGTTDLPSYELQVAYPI